MRKWIIFLVILAVVMSLAIAASLSFYWMFSQPVSVAKHSAIDLSLGGVLSETPSQNPLVQLMEPDRPSLIDYWQMLNDAAQDDRVLGVYLEVQPLAGSWGQLEELRDAIVSFRESGKPVHAFMAVDMIGEAEYYLASAADTITVNPDTSLMINGLVAEVTFYKRSLDKLGIKPQFIQFKEFKSPAVYERETMTPEIREMMGSILGDIENRFVSTVASAREIDADAVRSFVGHGINTPKTALEAGWIDRIGYRQDVFDDIDKLSSSKIKRIEAKDYLKGKSDSYGTSGHEVALVTATGIITSGKSDTFSETLGGSTLASNLRKIRKSGRFDAVLMRVDSPGGSAVGSDMAWREVRLLEEAGIPVVVSMSGVAGSGGYYIAMGASRIVSQPSTITGSIGVIFGKFNLEGLYDWLGMSIDRVKLSPNADLFSAFTSLTDDQKKQVSEWMEEIYNGFVGKAAEGRGSTFEELEPKARGRIYTGAQALELGLVDAVGGYDVALEQVRDVLDLAPGAAIELIQYPPSKGLWEALTSSGLIETQLKSNSLEQWLETELQNMSTAAPRLLMPEVTVR